MSPRLAPIYTGEEMGLTNNSETYYLKITSDILLSYVINKKVI